MHIPQSNGEGSRMDNTAENYPDSIKVDSLVSIARNQCKRLALVFYFVYK